jgi:hypothetical protein
VLQILLKETIKWRRIMEEKLKLLLEADFSDLTEEENIDSYIALVKELKMISNKGGSKDYDPEKFLAHLGIENYIEDIEITYKSYPIKILYKQLPVIREAEILIKVVVLLQAGNFAFIMPEHVSEAYRELKDDPSIINSLNINFDLYAEIYGFNRKDVELQDLMKEAYVNAGGELNPFEIIGSLKQEYEDDKDEESSEESDSDFGGGDFGGDLGGSSNGMDDLFSGGDFEPMETEPAQIPEVEENLKAYKKFKKDGTALEALVEKMSSVANRVLKRNVKLAYLDENKNILLVEVDNAKVYKNYEHVPKVAKRSLTNFGEAIRKDKNTQMLDAFNIEGKKYFVISENLGNNFWYVSREKMDTIEEGKDIIKPLKKNIIRLKRSSIRQESRDYKPYRKDKEMFFRKNF